VITPICVVLIVIILLVVFERSVIDLYTRDLMLENLIDDTAEKDPECHRAPRESLPTLESRVR